MQSINIKPNEIIFLDYINGRDENFYIPNYWKFDYGIDTNKTIKKLIDLHYLSFEHNLNRNMFKSTIVQLKEILKENELKLSGNKQDLIDRILCNVDTDYLKTIFSKKIFLATSLGEELIRKNYLYIINKKKNYMFSDKEINASYQLGSQYSDNDRIWSILNKRNIDYSLQRKWSSYRSNLLHMANLLFEENKYTQALDSYISIFIIDLSGVSEDNYIHDINSLFVAPAIMKSIKNLLSLCEYKTNDISKLINNNIFCKNLPFNYYSNDTLNKILLDCLNDIPFNCKKYPYIKPNKNSSKYTYYGFYEDNSLDIPIPENNELKYNLSASTINSNEKISQDTKNKKANNKYSIAIVVITLIVLFFLIIIAFSFITVFLTIS